MTIDLRYPNSQLVKIAGTMPILEVVLQYLQGAEFFSTLDAFKGYWQFPLDPQMAGVLSFMTDRGVFTPKRLIQGCTDSVFMFQAGMQGRWATCCTSVCSYGWTTSSNTPDRRRSSSPIFEISLRNVDHSISS